MRGKGNSICPDAGIVEDTGQEQHHLNGRKQLMMKFNNIIARDNIENPLYSFMKYDTYDEAARIKEVKLNR